MKSGQQRALVATSLALVVLVVLAIWFLRADPTARDVEPQFTGAAHSVPPVDLHAAERAPRTTEVAQSTREEVQRVPGDPLARPGPTLVIARVTSVETGEPVAHVYVTAWRDAGTVLATPQEIETDESGTVEIEVEPDVELIISAQGDGRLTGTANLPISALSVGETREVALAVRTQEDLVLHGVVLRRDTREPIAGVQVSGEPRRRNGPAPSTSTANDGAFRLAVRSYATISVRYEHADYGTAVTLIAGLGDSSTAALEVLLEPCAAVRAHVVAADGADTSEWSAVATTTRAALAQPSHSWMDGSEVARWFAGVGSNGIALLDRLPAHAPLALEIRRGSRTVWQSSGDLVLEPGEVREVHVRVGGSAIVGVVREQSGEPASGVEIRAGPAGDRAHEFVAAPDSARRATVTTDSSGAYRLEGLGPGAWMVGPAPIPSDESDPRRDPAPISERVVLESADADAQHDITLERGAVIAGRVEHSDGSAAHGARVQALFGTNAGIAGAFANPDGTFVIGPLSAGAWDLFAIGFDSANSPVVRAETGSEGVKLVLRVPSTFSVRVVDESGAPVPFATVSVIAADGKGDVISSPTDARGFVELRTLATGVYNVAAVTPDGRFAAERDVALTAGGSVARELVPVPAGRARLRFEGPTDTAFVAVLERGLVLQVSVVTRGAWLEIAGPIGAVNIRIQYGDKSDTKSVSLARGSGPELVFDGNWR